MWRLCSSWSKLKARWGAAGVAAVGGFHSDVRRRASALAFSVVGETGAARRAARSASAPPKEGCSVVDISVEEEGVVVRVWTGRVVGGEVARL